MGQKKDTLLRWVNCCSDHATPVERIKTLSDGCFFIHILSFLNGQPTDASDPWPQLMVLLREFKLPEGAIDYDLAASGNEDELAKLIVICMHLTMVQKPSEVIKEKTMWNLSTEDQKVIESILQAIVNDDQLTRSRLIDVLQDLSLQETSFTRPVMFYTSSPLSSISKNSPLKRFLDSPMALRLTRLQKEISDKNEEIRRLQSELLTESDESSALSGRMDDLKRKVKELEKKNAELEQRLRDCQLPEASGPDSDVEIIHLKKQLKKMQNEYEASCQKYCDLNIEYEALKTRQEKDRKQIRQLQLDLNETVARFERESAEYQLLLDSIRTENVELKHALEEKAQWIDVLEEKSRTCSELHARLSAPRSPCERESIGYSLLSMEAEKLQDELETYRRNLTSQSEKFDSEKKLFQKRAAALEKEKSGLHRQVEEATLANQSLQDQLDQAKSSLEQLSLGCNTLSKEKEELRLSLDMLQTEFQKEMSRAQQQLDIRSNESLQLGERIKSLDQQLEETHSAKNAFERSMQELTQQKLELSQTLAALEQNHLDLQDTFSASQSKFQSELDEVSSQLQSSKMQIADQLQSIVDLEQNIESLRNKLVASEETASRLKTEKEQLAEAKFDLEQQHSSLQSTFESSKQEFQMRLEKLNVELESATTQIAVFCDSTSSLKSQLEMALQERLLLEAHSAKLESERSQLSRERDQLQVQVEQLMQSAQSSRAEFQTEKEGLLMELETRKQELSEQANRVQSAEKRHQEASQQIVYLESSVRSLEHDTAELIASRSFFEQQVSVLQAAIDTGKAALQSAVDHAKEDAATHESILTQHKETIQSLQVRLESLSEEKRVLESQVVDLGADKVGLAQQLAVLEQVRKEDETSRDILVAELETLQEMNRLKFEAQQQEVVKMTEEIASMEIKLERAMHRENEFKSCIEEMDIEKRRLVQQNDSLKEEVSGLVTLISEEKNTFKDRLNALKEELILNQKQMEESQHKIQSTEEQLAGLMIHKSSLESEVEKLSAECCKVTEELSNLEQKNHRMESFHKEQIEEVNRQLSQLTEEHTERIAKLNERLESAQQLNLQLKNDCTRLEGEREALHFEKSGFEQMYLEVKAACEEAETKVHMESELARQNVAAKELELVEQSAALEKLEQVVISLRLEKEAVESSYARQIQLLVSEKQDLLLSQSRLEEENASLTALSEASRKELEQRLADADLKLKEHSDLLQKSLTSRKQLERQVEALTETVMRLELDLKSAVEEKCQLANEMPVLQAVHGEMKNLELAVEQLTSEIQELSCKKNNLEKLREVLEIAKATAEEESFQLRQDVKRKEYEISQLAVKIETTGSLLEQSLRDKQTLQDRISDLESTVSSLNNNATESSQTVQTLGKQLMEREASLERTNGELNAHKEQSAKAQITFIKAMSDLQETSDNNRRELETTIAELKRELDVEKQLASEQTNSVQALTLARKEASELADSLKLKLAEMEVEMEELVKSETMLKMENVRLEEGKDSDQSRLEKEKLDISLKLENAEQQVAQLKIELETTNSSYSNLEKECKRLKADQQNAEQVKAHLEKMFHKVEANLQTTMAQLHTQLKTMDAELKSKSAEIIELSNSANTLKQKLETTVEEKENLERDYAAKISTLISEKENLLNKQASFEQETRELKAELIAEKSKTLQGKGEINLEHRKEKAALEARLQVAQSQMKSMQEKLVNMTVANNSQAPLEHKISMLTNELDLANKVRSELEKQLSELKVQPKEMTSFVKMEEPMIHSAKVSSEDNDSELAIIRKKYENAKKALVHKDEVIGQYAAKFEKMQNQLDSLNAEVANANADKKKLAIENRSLKTEQQHLLAQISSEKDKANARNTRHSLALQRGVASSDGGTLADAMLDARRRSLRPSRSEVVTSTRQPPAEVFRPPQLAFGDGSDANSIFKVPPSRRDSSSSVCSNRSDISVTSRGMNVPQGAGRLFTCDDEDGELFSSSYLNEMKEGKCRVEDSSMRVSELHRRNTMQPPHMRSAYPAEMNDERLRQNEMTIYEQPSGSSRGDNQNESLQQLSLATSMLSMNTPPAMNTRKRRSSSWHQNDMETPVMLPRKRRSYELDADVSSDSTDTRSISSSAERKKHRDASQTSYQRPGPPTPARNTTKENTSISTPSIGSSPMRATTKLSSTAKPGSKRTSPVQGTKGSKLTPASLVKRVQAKIRSNIQSSSENTPSSTRTTPRGSKLNIFRKPLGSRSYNSDAKF